MEIRELSDTVHDLLHPAEQFVYAEPVTEVIGGPHGDRTEVHPQPHRVPVLHYRHVPLGASPYRITAITVDREGFTLSGDDIQAKVQGTPRHATLPTKHTTTAILPPLLRNTVTDQVMALRSGIRPGLTR